MGVHRKLSADFDAAVFDKVLAFASCGEGVIDSAKFMSQGVSLAILYANSKDFLPPRVVKLGASIRLKCG
jgi:hypothetical protein